MLNTQYATALDTMFAQAASTFTPKTDPFRTHRNNLALVHWLAEQHQTEVMAEIAKRSRMGITITWGVIVECIFAVLGILFPGLGLLLSIVEAIIRTLLPKMPAPVPA